jgi:ABC-type antimicrobial peptide transport system permease subunit
MNVKNFIVGGIVGGIVNFLLGWLFYAKLFPDLYPETPDTKLEFIALGCLTFGFLVSFVFTKLAGITNARVGLTAGAVIGFLNGLSMNLFMYSGMPLNTQNMITDVAICTITGAIIGAAVALVNGKMK